MAFDNEAWRLQGNAMHYVDTREFSIAYPMFERAMEEVDEPADDVRTVEQAYAATQYASLLGSVAFARGVNGIHGGSESRPTGDGQEPDSDNGSAAVAPTHFETADQLFEQANAVSERVLSWLSAKPESTAEERQRLYAHLARVQQWYGRYQAARYALSGDINRATTASSAYDAAYKLGLKAGDQQFGFDTADAAVQLEVLRGGRLRAVQWLGRVVRVQLSANEVSRAGDDQSAPVDYSRQLSAWDRVGTFVLRAGGDVTLSKAVMNDPRYTTLVRP